MCALTAKFSGERDNHIRSLSDRLPLWIRVLDVHQEMCPGFLVSLCPPVSTHFPQKSLYNIIPVRATRCSKEKTHRERENLSLEIIQNTRTQLADLPNSECRFVAARDVGRQ